MVIFQSKFPDIVIPEVPLFQYVLENTAKYGDKIAFIDYSSKFSLTYNQLAKLTFCVAKNLRKHYQFNKGDVLAIFLPNHPMYPVVFFGTQMTGAAVTTVNPLYTATELEKQLVDSGASLIVTIPMFLDKVLEGCKGSKVKSVFVLSGEPVEAREVDGVQVKDLKVALLAPPDNAEPVSVQINPKEDVCMIPYSSGTTGLCKGVCLTHYNIVANVEQVDELAQVTEQDTIVGILPFFHIYGLVLLVNKSLRTGTTVVIMPKFEFVDFLKIIQEYKITKAHLVPPIILGLAKMGDKFNHIDFSSLKEILSGAAPLSADLQKAADAKLPGTTVRQGYGMTELSPVVCVQELHNCIEYAGSAGVLINNTLLRIVDTATGEEKGVGEEGELCFKGPQMMKGYLNNEEATKQTIDAEGWLHTGDVGYIDASGNIFIVDRVKELIKFKGFQVPPAELEGILLKHDSIADAAVIGIPDAEAGELPKAFVVLKANHTLTEQQVMDFVSDKVAPYKKLRFVEFTSQIPKSASGKILRRLLKLHEKEK